MIVDLKCGDEIEDIFYCKQKTLGTAKNGSNYYAVLLQDNSGTINAKIWDINNRLILDFNTGDFIKVKGTVSSFNNNLQITITEASLVETSDININDFCPVTPKDTEELESKLHQYVDTIEDEYLNKLLRCFFDNEKFMNRFKTASAAKTVHHAYIGGLLEHSVAVADICGSLISIYPKVNRDLIITAALCHDIGKVREISAFPENDYTDVGQLLGHIYMGAEMIDVQARKIDNFPKPLLNELKHCILAHHGTPEFGSPQTPKLLEAQLLHMADSTDAKMRRFSDLLDDVNGYDWSDKSDYFLGNKYRITRG